MNNPPVDDVYDGLERYLETKARADELGEELEETNQFLDKTVCELYGLTEEEIEIVEEAVSS